MATRLDSGERCEDHRMTHDEKPDKIVVGVDGSPSSEQALRWATRHARLSSGELHAVTVWAIPTTYGWAPVAADFDWEDIARSNLEQTLRDALGETEAARVQRHVVQGHPAHVLLDAAADADLLVVGSRGRGGFTGLLLGSVSQHVIAHADCPVVVVRETAAVPTSVSGEEG